MKKIKLCKRLLTIISVLFFSFFSLEVIYGIYRTTLNTTVNLTVLDPNTSYTIRFEIYDGTGDFDPIARTLNSPLGELDSPTKTNYNFVGWYTDSNFTTKVNPTTKVTGDMTLHAKYEKIICKKAVAGTLHNAEICRQSGSAGCAGVSSLTIGLPIEYGTIPNGSYSAGEAYDCDVNNDGVYSPTNERFYLIREIPENDTYALIMYTSIDEYGYIETTGTNKRAGETYAYNATSPYLPTANDATLHDAWANPGLKTFGLKVARYPTVADVGIACDLPDPTASTARLDNCYYLMENSRFQTSSSSEARAGIWLEAIGNNHWRIQTETRAVTTGNANAVRPVIEIPVETIEGLPVRYKYTAHFHIDDQTDAPDISRYSGQALGTLSEPVKAGYEFKGWFTDNVSYSTEVTEHTLMPAHDVDYYAKWDVIVDNLEYVFRIEGKCTFNGANGTITSPDGTCISVDKLGVTTDYTQSGNETNHIETGISLFNSTNISKDFEVGFTIDSYVAGSTVFQATILNSKLESSALYYPGFVVRKGSNGIQLTEKFNNVNAEHYYQYTAGMTIRVMRRNGKMYYTEGDGEPILLQDITNFNQPFNLAVWFGAISTTTDPTSTGAGTGVDRVLSNTTLSNMYIKLERDNATPIHVVTFSTPAGELDMPSTRNVFEGSAVGQLPTVTREHYHFDGWAVDGGDGTLITSSYLVNADVTLVAQFTPLNYTITFVTNDGSAVAPLENQAYGSFILSLPSTLKAHHTFAGWYTDPGLNTQVTTPYEVTGDATFYAGWTPDTHTITFVSNGGTNVDPITVDYGTAPGANFPAAPTKTDYNFAGWYSDPELTIPVNADTVVYGDVYYYAKWTDEDAFSITFNTQDGDPISPIGKNYGDQLGPLPTPTKTYFDFVAWYLDSDLTIPADANATVTGDVELYAGWSLKSIYVAQVENDYFETLAEAVTAVPNGTKTTVHILKNIELSALVSIPNGKDIVMDGGSNTVSSTVSTIFENSGTLEIASGTYSNTVASQKVVINLSGKTLRVSGGTITSTKSNSIENSGTVYITGGLIKTTGNNQGSLNNNAAGVVYVSGGTIDNTGNRQAIYNAGQVYVSGDAYLTSASSQRATIHNYANNAKVEISGGTVEGRGTSCNTGTVENAANLTGTSIIVTGGTITSASTNTTAGVAAIRASSGSLRIGTEDGSYDTTSPVIQAKRHGVYATVDYAVYDGIIKGKTAAVNNMARITSTEVGTTEVTSTENIGSDTYYTLYYELASGFRVTFDPDGGSVTPTKKVVEENTAVGELPTPEKTGYVFAGWYDSGNQLVTEETIVSADDTVYTARWVNSVLQANIANTAVTLNVSGTSSINVTNAATIEPFTYSSKDTSVATVNSSGVITATGPGITQVVLTGDSSGDTKYVTVTSNISNDIQTFDIMPSAMRTYFDNIDTWAAGQTDDSHTSFDTYMSNNLSTHNCINFNVDDRQNKSSSTGSVFCDVPNQYDTGITGEINVYEYNPSTNMTVKLASYVTVNNGKIYNVIPGKTYYWVSASDSTQNGKFYAFGERRILQIDNLKNGSSDTYFQTRNVRDLGGIKVTYKDANNNTVNGTIKYEKLFRGEKIWGGAGNSLQYFTKLGIDHEMDLRSNSEPVASEEDSFADSNKIRSASKTFEIIHYGIDYSANSSNYTLARNAVIAVMNAFIEAADSNSANYNPNYALYFHCRIGADRTGTLAYLLEGLLGVSEEDRYRDYELSSFFGLDERTRFYYNKGSNTTKFVYMKQAMRNASLDGTEDVVEWFLKGSSNRTADMALIQEFRRVMIDQN